MDWAAVIAYAPVAMYLVAIWVMQSRRTAIPVWFHITAALTGMVVVGILINPIAPLMSLAFAAVFFVASVAIAGQHMTRTGIISFSVAIAASPPVVGWVGLLCGVAIAAIISLITISRRMGKDRAVLTVYESAGTLGMNGAIPTKGVDVDRIPAASVEEVEEAKATGRRVSAGSMRLAPFMLVGVALAAAYSAIF